jgi:glycosyltransferase involved in cell wall biosynthesis
VTAALPLVSVVMPAYRCAGQLRESMAGLLASALPREQWELIVADDGSPDNTGATAALVADRVVRVDDGPRGPAHARNMGARVARGAILLFVDADVVVHPDVLSMVVAHFQRDPTLGAVFGSYDDQPAASGLVSQYRNLLHRRVHLAHAGASQTFWAGCGAVRRDAFMAVSGFDAARFPRPQIEDIDLGYRLHDGGERILLDPTLLGTHLKHWTLRGMLRTDLRDRAIPWMRLLLERRTALHAGPLNTNRREQMLTVLMALCVVLFPAALVWQSGALLTLGMVALMLVLLSNAALFLWFAQVRGVPFAFATVPLRLLFYVVSAAGASWAVVTNPWQPVRHPRTSLALDGPVGSP